MAYKSELSPFEGPAVHRFGDEDDLQVLSVWKRPSLPSTSSPSRYWVIFIHGGAWRDPTITHLNFAEPSVTYLSKQSPSNNASLDTIEAFASLSYRLSPHPTYPNKHAASHPDHILDVRAGVAFLQQKYGFGSRYILVGHSCGATLAFQTLMDSDSLLHQPSPPVPSTSTEPHLERCTAIVGLAGIYDLRLLRDTHSDSPYAEIYQSFLVGAFGPDETLWDKVSPASYRYQDMEKQRPLVLLVTASEDELVDIPQLDAMRAALSSRTVADVGAPAMEVLVELVVEGGHDEMWQKGEHMGGAVRAALERLASFPA